MKGVASSGSGREVGRKPHKSPNKVKIYQHDVKNYVKM